MTTWEVSEFGHSYRNWRIAYQPQPGVTDLVKKWARDITCHGPSTSAIPISESGEDFMDWIDDTGVFVTYVVSHRDQHVIVKDLSP